MKKTVIYVNRDTGKRVLYGENITFQENGTYDNGYKWSSTTTLPVINDTIPMLIEKGILVQKEIEKKKAPEEQRVLSVDEKLDTLATAVSLLLEQMNELRNDFYGGKD